MYKYLMLIFFIHLSLGAIPHYFATSADSRFFDKVCSLVKTIHKNDGKELAQIAVFDLGFLSWQRKHLNSLSKVTVYDLEKKHSDLLKFFKTAPNGRQVRGWFAWKPVALKQALDMFPYVLYLDSAMEVFRPLDDLFLHIKQHGYFLIDSGDTKEQSLPYRITKIVEDKIIKKLSSSYQSMLMNEDIRIISAGIQGLSQKYFDSYLRPVYDLVSDVNVFSDDGTAKLGFGAGRHDQIPFSIYAALNGLQINRAGWQNIVVDGKRVPFHCHWNRKDLNRYSAIKY